jgi:hypothetical protein
MAVIVSSEEQELKMLNLFKMRFSPNFKTIFGTFRLKSYETFSRSMAYTERNILDRRFLGCDSM